LRKPSFRAFESPRDYFGADCRATAISAARLTAYPSERKEQGKALATINTELAALRRGFNLAVEKGLLAFTPKFPTIKLNNARQGFFEEADYHAVRSKLPDYLQPVIEVAYYTGWRVRSELLPLTWDRVDLDAGVIRLDPGTTKNNEGRTFPYRQAGVTVLPELEAVLQLQRARTDETQRRLGMVIPYVFHREGRPIRDFYAAWRTACTAAGLPGRIPHDFRRTAVRNMERRGVPRSVAMKLVGHKTESMYRRYAIVNEAQLVEGVAKLAGAHTASSGSHVAQLSHRRAPGRNARVVQRRA
jgi:integrase